MQFELEELEKIHTFMQMAFVERSITQEECLKEVQDVITHTKKIKRSNTWDVLKSMPPLYHTLPDKEFSYDSSEVLEWMSKNKVILGWLLNSAYKINYLKYCKTTGKWQGVEYNDD